MFNLLKLKPITIALLLLLLSIPLAMINELVGERHRISLQVHQDIANSSSRAQQVIGPFLVLETEQYQQDLNNGQPILKTVNRQYLILPKTLKADSQLQSEIRSRGIYQTRLYHTQNRMALQFVLEQNLGFEVAPEVAPMAAPGAVKLKSAHLVLALSDVRGLIGMPQFKLNQQTLQILPGTGISALSGVHAKLDLATLLAEPKQLQLEVTLGLTGTDQLSLLPTADHSSWNLTADWPHPGFFGRFLPQQRDITAEGFNANWQSTLFANNVQPQLQKCVLNNECEALAEHSFQVSLVEPVDHYLQANRAVKYALMVLVISFAVYYLFELLAKLQIHPMQYLFIGLALAMFYLLLLSLSEVVGFAMAYGIATFCCVSLIGGYTASVLKSISKALACSVGLSCLYALLLMILRAEDLALLAGSLLMFLVLAAIMLSTRHLNWYQLQQDNKTE
jgi:inner membrane protein